jgi:excisionase family DNA binding protein
MQDQLIKKTFCTTREAATLLGVSVGTVQLWAENGLLQAWKTTGGHRRVLRDSVSNLLQDKSLKRPDSGVPETPQLLTSPQPGLRRLRVLVVEDDLQLLRLYQVKVSAWHLKPEVSVTDNAMSALMMIGRQSPDLLVTDLQMPGMDGFKMLRVLRETPETKRTRIVVVSGLDAEEIQDRGGLPADVELFPKPIPFNRLLAVATDLARQNLQKYQAAE